MKSRLALWLRTGLALLVTALGNSAAASPRKFTQAVHVASHQLGFSNAVVSVREDYTHTKWPIAHRTFLLRGANGRLVSLLIHDGGPGQLTTLSLYKRAHPDVDGRGHAIGGDYVLLGVRDCVGFDPVFLDVKVCSVRPPCSGDKLRAELIYLGRFDYANGYDPPRGQFQLNWRFLPFEEGTEESFCPESATGR